MHSAQVSYEHSLQQVSCKHSFCCTDSEKELAKLLNEGESIICRRAWSLLAAASVRNLLQGVLTVYLFHCTNRESAIFKCGRIDYICRSACNLLAAESARSTNRESKIFKCGRIDYHRQIGLLAVVLHRQRERAKINKYCKFDCQIYLRQKIATRDKIFFRDLTLNQNMAYHFDQFFFCYLLNNWPHDFTSPAD